MADNKIILDVDASTSKAEKSLGSVYNLLYKIYTTTDEKLALQLANPTLKAIKDLTLAENNIKKTNVAIEKYSLAVKEVEKRHENAGEPVKLLSAALMELNKAMVVSGDEIKRNNQYTKIWSDIANHATSNINKTTANLQELSSTFRKVSSNLNVFVSQDSAATKALVKKEYAIKDTINSYKLLGATINDVSQEIKELENTQKGIHALPAGREKTAAMTERGIKIDALKSRVREIEASNDAIRKAIQYEKSLETQIAKNNATIDSNMSAIETMKNKQAQYAAEIKKSEDAISLLNKELVRYKGILGQTEETEKLEKSLSELKASAKLANNEFKTITATITALERKTDALTSDNNALRRTQEAVTNSLSESKRQLEENVSAVGRFRTAISQLKAADSQIINTDRAAQKATGTFKLMGRQLRSTIYDVNALRYGFILLTSSTGLGYFIRTIAEFDKSMARVKALMFETREETAAMTYQLKLVGEEARQLGATTKFTAGEVGEAAVILSQAGLTAAEIIDTLKGTLDLAVAGNLEMADSADIVVKSINMFGLATRDAIEVANVYAIAANISATSVEKMAHGMVYAGSVAKTFGMSIQETAAVMATLANAGIESSVAGTQLRRMMIDIQNPTARASKTLATYGLNLKKMREEGNSSLEILRAVITKLGGTGDAAKVFRVTALPGIEALAENIEMLDKAFKRIDEVPEDYSEKLAKINMDNVIDQFIQLKSAVEDVFIRIGQETGFTEWLTGFLRDTSTAIREWEVDLGELITTIGVWITRIVAVVAAFRPLKALFAAAMTGATGLASKYKILAANASATASTGKILTASFIGMRAAAYAASAAIVTLAKSLARIALITIGIEILIRVIGKLYDVISAPPKGEIILNRYADLAGALADNVYDASGAIETLESKIGRMNKAELTINKERVGRDIELLTGDRKDSVLSEIIAEKTDRNRLNSSMLSPDFFGEDAVLAEINAEVQENNRIVDILKSMQGKDADEIADIVADIGDPKIMEELTKAFKKYGFEDIHQYIAMVEAAQFKLQKLGEAGKKFEPVKFDFKEYKKEPAYEFSQIKPPDIGMVALDLAKELDRVSMAIPNEEFRELLQTVENLGDYVSYNNISKGLEIKPAVTESYEKFLDDLEKVGLHLYKLSHIPQGFSFFDKQREKAEALQAFLLETINKFDALESVIESYNYTVNELNFKRGLDDSYLKAHEKELEDNLKARLETLGDGVDTYIKNVGEPVLTRLFFGEDTSEFFKKLKVTMDETGKVLYNGLPFDKIKGTLFDELTKVFGDDTDSITKSLKILEVFDEIELKSKRGRKRKAGDYELQFYRVNKEIAEATHGLSKQWEQLVKIRQIEADIERLREDRTKKENQGNEWLDKLIARLEQQIHLMHALTEAQKEYEQAFREEARLAEKTSAYGIESGLGRLSKDLQTIQELSFAISQMLESPGLEDFNMSSQLKHLKEIYDIKEKQLLIQEQLNFLEKDAELFAAKNHGTVALWQEYEMKGKILEIEKERTQYQINALANENRALLEQLNTNSKLTDYEREKILNQMELNDLLMVQLAAERELAQLAYEEANPNWFQGFRNAVAELKDSVASDAEIMKEAVLDAANSIEDNLVDNLTTALSRGAVSWDKFFSDIADSFYRAAVRMLVTENMAKILGTVGDFLTGSFKGVGSTTSMSTDIFASGTKVPTPYDIFPNASGGIIKRATYIPTTKGTALAGEAGAEAIMPLKRLSNGKLGVYTDSGGQQSNSLINENSFSFNITMQGSSGDQQQDERYAKDVAQQVRATVRAEIATWARDNSREGGFFSSLKR